MRTRRRAAERQGRTDDLARARAFIQRSGNIRTGLEDLRNRTAPRALLDISAGLASHPAYKPLIWPSAYPRSFVEIKSRSMSYYEGYATELAWAAGSLAPHAPRLATFIGLRRRLETATLLGRLSEADRILQEVEDEFGASLWLLESRLNLFQARGQNRAHRDHFRQALHGAVPVIVRFLASWLAYKSEAAVSAAEVRRLLEKEEAPEGIAVLVGGMMGRYPEVTPDLIGRTLSFTDALPVIDRYSVLVLGQQLLAASGMDDEDDVAVTRSAVALLAARIPDPQLSLLSVALEVPGTAPPADPMLMKLLEDYGAARYPEVVAGVRSAPTDALSIELLNLGVRAATLLGETLGPLQQPDGGTSGLASLADDLAEVVAFGAQATEANLRLRKRQLTHCNSSWASSLALVLDRQRNDERALAPKRSQTVHALRSAVWHPDIGFCLPQPVRTRFLDTLAAMHPGSISVQAMGTVLAGDDVFPADLASERVARLNAMAHARRGRWAEAAMLLETVRATGGPTILETEASLLLIRCYLEQGRLADCAALAVKLYLSSNYIGSVIPIARLVAELVKVHDEPMATSSTRGLLSVAIAYDIYSRYVGPGRDAHRADAFNDVLRRGGVSRASQLAVHQQTYDLDQLTYFWRQVCVPDVLDQSLALRSTREVEDERAAILVALSDVIAGQERQQPSELKDELREIRTKQVVRETTLRLDQSKVYVNVEGIRRALDVGMRDNWHRYRILGLQGGGLGDFHELERIVRSPAGDRVFIMLNTESLERGKLLARMVAEVIDMFAFSKEFGLDSNLSTNIRHGYVLRELRSPLLALKLITNRSSSSGDYQLNSFWIERLPRVRDGERLTAILDRFSARVDEIIERVNRKLLRIRSQQLPDGLFHYPQQDELRLVDLERRCADLETHEQFLDVVIEQCWLLTDANLTRVREDLGGRVFDWLGAALTDLQAEVTDGGFGVEPTGLVNAITMARSDMRSAVNRVASWFTLSSNNEYQDFDLQIAFEAGLKTVKTYYSNVEITSTLAASDAVLLRGWTLPMFARLFFLLLDNAAQHGAEEREELSISTRMEVNAESLFIEVRNDLPTGYDAARLAARVAAINADYGRDTASDLLRQEGGTGYPKIWKLLNFDLRKNHALNVELVDDEFVVEVMVDTKGIV